MAFISTTQQILGDFKTGYDAAKAKYDEAHRTNTEKLHKYYITDAGFTAAMEQPTLERDKAVSEINSAGAQKVRDALDKYLTALDQRYLRTADSIDQEDVQLLSSDVVSLSARDVESMFNKYMKAGNMVMAGIVSDYETKHKTGAQITFYSHDARAEAAKEYAQGCIHAMNQYDNGGLAFAFYESAAAVPPELQGE